MASFAFWSQAQWCVSEYFGFSVHTVPSWAVCWSVSAPCPVLCQLYAFHFMALHGNSHASVSLPAQCWLGLVCRGCRSNLVLMTSEENVEVSVAPGCTAYVTFTFHCAAGHVPLQSHQRVCLQTSLSPGPRSSDPSPDRNLITHRAFNSWERQMRRYSAAGYFFLSLSPSQWVLV